MMKILLIHLLSIGLALSFPQEIKFGEDDEVEQGRVFCEEPTVLWKSDGECYPLGERGPCKEDEILDFLKSSMRSVCVKDPNIEERPEKNKMADSDSEADATCNDNEMILWPSSGECYELLTQGPCKEGEWLVLESINPARGKCEPVPCDLGNDEIFWSPLCECVNRLPRENATSLVGVNYGPEDLCGVNQEILWTPQGTGICACIPGFYADEDEVCHELGSQGPCDEDEVWQVVVDKVTCSAESTVDLKVRVFDLIYQNPTGSAQTVRCFKDSKGRCRQTVGHDSGRFAESESFTNFLASFAADEEIFQNFSKCPLN